MPATDPPPLNAGPPDLPCPDCGAPAGRYCYPDCPRYADDGPFEEVQAHDHPDGF